MKHNVNRQTILLTVLLAAGIVLLAACNVHTSAGFLVFVVGCACLLAGWLVLLHRLKQSGRMCGVVRILKILTLCTLGVFLVSLLVVEGLIITHASGTAQPDADCLIVLGAGVRGDQPSLILKSRLDATVTYLNAHPAALAVVSGGKGPDETVTEASVMRAYLLHAGIAEDRILTEDQATDTRQNLQYSMDILSQQDYHGDVALVSNTFHLYRAEQLAAQQGLRVQTIGAPVPLAWLVPSVYLREYCSVLLMQLRQII